MALIQLQVYSESLDFQVPLSVIYPYENNKIESIKTMILLHGYSGGHQDFIRYTKIEKMALEKNIAIVMPGINNSFYTDMKNGPNYFKYLTKDIPKIISSIFNLKTNKENLMIAGVSMGGYGALKAAFTYPDNYFAVLSLSSIVYIENAFDQLKSLNQQQALRAAFNTKEEIEDKDKLNKLANSANNIKIYMTCGFDDFLFEDNKKFSNFLKEQKIDHEFIANEGNHNWDYWDYNLRYLIDKIF
jgi:putative tributyrin esterase